MIDFNTELPLRLILVLILSAFSVFSLIMTFYYTYKMEFTSKKWPFEWTGEQHSIYQRLLSRENSWTAATVWGTVFICIAFMLP